jgi:exopolyphosphatase/guanosine-5'-triphosphate,3'-diphosphate pyrophosphatase
MEAEIPVGRMNRNVFLFELGSTSLKLHFRLAGDDQAREMKTPWNIGHEVFQSGRISPESIAGAVSTVKLMLSWLGRPFEREAIIAVATGAFRHGENSPELVETLRNRTGLSVRVISGGEEASLLARQFQRTGPRPPAFAFDLGGGSLQWVSVERADRSSCGSIGVGAIRLLKEATSPGGDFMPCVAEHLAEEELSRLSGVKAHRVVGTGGTIKALSGLLGARIIRALDIEALECAVRTEGPPHELMPHRRPIFLPGVILIVRLMRVLEARDLLYENLSVGEALLDSLLHGHEEASGGPGRMQVFEHVRASRFPAGWMADSRVDPLTQAGG